jgi:protein phosphatase
MLTVDVYAHTEVGLIRAANEDHLLMGRFIKNSGSMQLSFGLEDDFLCEYGMLFAVADGIGGEAGGTFASQLALLTLEKCFYAVRKSGKTVLFKDILQQAIYRCNKTILEMAKHKPKYSRMGCTLAGVCLIPEGVLVFQCGDSRIYYQRGNLLKLITVDETVAQIAVNAGRLSADEARHSPQRHHLTNFLGYEQFSCQVKLLKPLQAGDTLLICSDGLHDLIDPEHLKDTLLNTEQGSVASIGKKLTQQALDAGGDDNLSLIVLQLSKVAAS